VRRLRRFLEPLRRTVVPELVGEPETLLIESTLLEVLHPRQLKQSVGFEGAGWVRWGSFALYGVKLHLLCATNRVPICYELTPANVAEVRLVGDLLGDAHLGEGLARRLLGDLAYRSEKLGETLASAGVALVSERSRQHGVRQQAEVAFSTLKRVFGIEHTLAKTLVGLATRIVAKVTVPTLTDSTSTASWAERKVG
jgi:Transposase DDE domain